MLEQVTVFLENDKGRLRALTRVLADAQVNMYALTIAETSDYGLVRIVCDDPEGAVEALRAADMRAIVTKVLAVEVPNRPGGLADLLGVFEQLDLNIEYGYCFSVKGATAVDVLKVADPERSMAALKDAGYNLVTQQDLA
ncbi:MAG: ACT domain-containing protein [Coriobacteriales bacterium]|nr:ACT domain-containing protein [Coriobacteriales bacterium]